MTLVPSRLRGQDLLLVNEWVLKVPARIEDYAQQLPLFMCRLCVAPIDFSRRSRSSSGLLLTSHAPAWSDVLQNHTVIV